MAHDVQGSNAVCRNYVLAHGSWHGGWCWAPVAERLEAAGHRVFAPSHTGMGDRAHLLSRSITIDTFVQDLVGLIEAEDLRDVVLVGHSFAGVPITGVADRIPGRIARLVYFDSIVLESGQTAFSIYPHDEVQARIAAAGEASGGLAVPVPDPLPPVWGLIPGTSEYEWARRHLTPHPLGSYTTALTLQHPIGNGLPCTYIYCAAPSNPVLENSRALAKAQAGWDWIEIAAPHDAHITHPDMMAGILLA
ncbi:MAG: alpha/beta fold hydrolase [Alcaligenaceae bacterium]|nr:alpha/beta fold hydrolase [Alcaligenaceae bacterium]